MAVNPAHASAAPQITGAIRQAAQSTGISFEYLLTTAKIESNLNPSAQASTSSAKGLYQFIDQTWLGTMKQDGAALGLSQYADAITRAPDGHYEVADPAMRAAILRLRTDPQASAMLAGALTRNNAALVGASIGRQPTNGELYIAHFLGADGAGKLINGAASRPQANAAAMFPHAAAANHNIFYDHGRARSVGEVYGKLTSLFDSARTVAFAQGGVNQPAVTRSGGAPPLPPAVTVAARPVKAVPASAMRVASAAPPIPPAPIPTPLARAPTPDTAGTTQALARASEQLPPPPARRPSFQSMFTDRVSQPLAPTVTTLWGVPPSGGPQAAQSVQVFDLFSDMRPNERKLGDKA
ncbi:MAG TPA: transglycosylase SLT domain-containing protein [Pseudolabrys sp.]|nr:transglycosylase SLT domain-containing protein [Pseudolabrys sp.]